MRKIFIVGVLVGLASFGLAQATPPPVIFFTDVLSGPVSGNTDTTYAIPAGSAARGPYVTLYGNFLDNFTSVKLNGQSCLTVVSNPSTWLWYQRMVVMLGDACASGNFSITTPSGTWNGPSVGTSNAQFMFGWNGQDFTVSTGQIRYVATTGNDANAGTFSSPWRHPYYALHTLTGTAGNVVYLKAGTYPERDIIGEWEGGCINPTPGENRGTANNPNAMSAYPNAAVQVCTDTGETGLNGFYSKDQTAWLVPNEGYWTFANFAIRSGTSAGPMQNSGGQRPNQSIGYRYIALDVASPNAGDSGLSQFQAMNTTKNQVFGTYNHDSTLRATSRLNQMLYVGINANMFDIGWNEIYNNGGRGAIQTHTDSAGNGGGWAQDNIWIHDNKIHHIQGECILIDTPDPHLGPAGYRLYNNVLYDCSRDASSNGSLVWEYSGDPCTIGSSPPPMWIYNNSIYNHSTVGDQYGGVIKTFTLAGGMCGSGYTTKIHYANNLVTGTSGSHLPLFYLENQTNQGCADNATLSTCPPSTGSTNLIFGKGGVQYPNILLNTVTTATSPVVNLAGFDLHLTSGSAAIGRGLATITDPRSANTVSAPTYDFDGRVRPNPPSIGAYEYAAGASNPSPAVIQGGIILKGTAVVQ